MICDICGSKSKLYKTIVEGAELSLCHECSKFGKVVGIVQESKPSSVTKKQREEEPEVIEILVDNYAKKIRKKREEMGLTQKEFAQKLNEKESVIQKIESGNFNLPIDFAKKIGKLLKISIVEEQKEEQEKVSTKTTAEGFTIGDFINVRR